MSRPATRIATGLALLALAVVCALLARGVDQAGREWEALQAFGQGVPSATADPGTLAVAGERLLGVHARTELLRAWRDYRLGLANVIPGTTYPQTQARWNAIAAVTRLRSSLEPRDRAAADVLLGRVYAAAAAASGPTTQRVALRDSAIAAMRRAVLGDPSSAEAKHDLETLLAEAGAAGARSQGSARRPADGKPAAVPRAGVEGSGY
jgi:hypothetical protein